MDDWDWELLHESQDTPPPPPPNENQQSEEQPTNLFSSDDDKISGVIQSDYFSINSNHDEQTIDDDDDGEGDSSDNPSWIDPSNITVSGTRIRNSSSSNSDSSGPTSLHLIHSTCDNHHYDLQVDAKDEGEVGDDSDTGGGGEEERGSEAEAEAKAKEEGEKEKEKVVWWKVPMEVLRYCVIRVSPVWSISMAAAALMGFIILRRRYLYKMKRKTLGFQLKLTVDDKKESQFMSRVARLNEAFSVVKRVPMIRPSLPAPGLAPWPVMSMR